MNKLLGIIFFALCAHLAAAQDSENEFEKVEKSSRISYTNNYTSRLNFEGRDVSEPQYAINNTFTYQSNKGFQAYFGVDYWNKFTPNGIAQTTLGGAYEFKAGKRVNGSIGYEHWFVNSTNDTLKNALTNYINTNWEADFEFIAAHASASYIFGTESAYNFQTGINGLLEFEDIFKENQTDKISIAPDITLISGTDVQFTTINTVVKRRKKTIINSTTSSNSVFGLLNTELTLPVTYAQPRWSVTAAYHYAIPHSLGATDVVLPAFGYFVVGFNWHIFVLNSQP